MANTVEFERLNKSDESREAWQAWGPYLSERQWGTVREDYSPGGTAWDFFPHDHARSRAYRWGEDGIAGFSDEKQRLCFSLALWNGNDAILKERMFGLTNDQGNHGEDVKELYFYQDSTPTHSYMKMLYKYPQMAYPYADLMAENGRRKNTDPHSMEYELVDTGAFHENRYFDVEIEYAKRSPTDTLIRISATNHGPQAHRLCLLPTLWFRNTWSWRAGTPKPSLSLVAEGVVESRHPELGTNRLVCPGADAMLFCENETNNARLFGEQGGGYPKDGINDHLLHGADTVNPAQTGTKCSALYDRMLKSGETVVITLRLTDDAKAKTLGTKPESVFLDRIGEANEFYDSLLPSDTAEDMQHVARQAYAGMMWSKQYFYYVVSEWLDGDDHPPPAERMNGRNKEWRHFYADDVISMPDTWEYPWFASWDLCFHTVVLARIDLQFAKDQVLLLCREWYMRPDGQAPAYEWAFDDVNPPVQIWAGLKIAEHELETFGTTDHGFLQSLFDHGLLYFTWWVNRKDAEGNNLFQGGFLGLDNISVFDRSSGFLPGGGRLFQSDGTTWAAFFALQMMEMALILSKTEARYVELAAKFFQHFVFIADAMDHLSRESEGSAALWNEEDGLYYDVMKIGDAFHPLKARSLVSLIPLIAVAALDLTEIEKADNPHFSQRLEWFRNERAALFDRAATGEGETENDLLLTFLGDTNLKRLLGPMLDESEFLSPYGIRSLSLRHRDEPFSIEIEGQRFEAGYAPAESGSGMFGGNSNWRGPIWMPMNYIIIDALRVYYRHYGPDFKVECPTGSGVMMSLAEVADEISCRLVSIFTLNTESKRPVFGGTTQFHTDPSWRENVLFYEYFHGDNGAGIGASHQTGWTGLVAALIQEQEYRRAAKPAEPSSDEAGVMSADPIPEKALMAAGPKDRPKARKKALALPEGGPGT